MRLNIFYKLDLSSKIFIISNFHNIFWSLFNFKSIRTIKWVFVFGVGHTGSSILCRKFAFFDEFYSCQFETGMMLGSKLRAQIYRLILAGIATRNNKKFVLEKTPMHWRTVDKIRNIFPDAEFIVTQRSLLDTAISQAQRFDNNSVVIDVISEFYALRFEQLLWKINGIDFSVVDLEDQENFLNNFCNKYNLTKNLNINPLKMNFLEKTLAKFGIGYFRTNHERERLEQVSSSNFIKKKRSIDVNYYNLVQELERIDDEIDRHLSEWYGKYM